MFSANNNSKLIKNEKANPKLIWNTKTHDKKILPLLLTRIKAIVYSGKVDILWISFTD